MPSINDLIHQINAWRRKVLAEIAEYDAAVARQRTDKLWGMF